MEKEQCVVINYTNHCLHDACMIIMSVSHRTKIVKIINSYKQKTCVSFCVFLCLHSGQYFHRPKNPFKHNIIKKRQKH